MTCHKQRTLMWPAGFLPSIDDAWISHPSVKKNRTKYHVYFTIPLSNLESHLDLSDDHQWEKPPPQKKVVSTIFCSSLFKVKSNVERTGKTHIDDGNRLFVDRINSRPLAANFDVWNALSVSFVFANPATVPSWGHTCQRIRKFLTNSAFPVGYIKFERNPQELLFTVFFISNSIESLALLIFCLLGINLLSGLVFFS